MCVNIGAKNCKPVAIVIIRRLWKYEPTRQLVSVSQYCVIIMAENECDFTRQYKCIREVMRKFKVLTFDGFVYAYSKTPLLRPPLGLRKNGLYSGVVLRLSKDKEEINEMGL